jgi:hypothetical protein
MQTLLRIELLLRQLNRETIERNPFLLHFTSKPLNTEDRKYQERENREINDTVVNCSEGKCYERERETDRDLSVEPFLDHEMKTREERTHFVCSLSNVSS